VLHYLYFISQTGNLEIRLDPLNQNRGSTSFQASIFDMWITELIHCNWIPMTAVLFSELPTIVPSRSVICVVPIFPQLLVLR
jgi:hypothetical protein